MVRTPLTFTARNPLEVELALTLQVLYVLGKAEEHELPGLIQEIGPLNEAHELHLHIGLMLRRGVTISLILPYDTHEVAGQNSAAYLRDIWRRGGFTPEQVETHMASQPFMQSRAVALQGYMEMYPDQLVEHVAIAQPANVLDALQMDAVVHMRVGDQAERNLLAGPMGDQTCWVYDLATTRCIYGYPILDLAQECKGQIAVYSAMPIGSM